MEKAGLCLPRHRVRADPRRAGRELCQDLLERSRRAIWGASCRLFRTNAPEPSPSTRSACVRTLPSCGAKGPSLDTSRSSDTICRKIAASIRHIVSPSRPPFRRERNSSRWESRAAPGNLTPAARVTLASGARTKAGNRKRATLPNLLQRVCRPQPQNSFCGHFHRGGICMGERTLRSHTPTASKRRNRVDSSPLLHS